MLNYAMKFIASLLIISSVLTSCSHTYYVVRHAEKDTGNQGAAMMAVDPRLSEAGKLRAEKLKEILRDKKIANVFATGTIRAKSTAQPTADHFGLAVQLYSITDSSFFVQLKKLKSNVLIVGHSNTVKNIVNGLCSEEKIKSDLGDNEYNHLFMVRYKRFFGLHIVFTQQKY
jgi:phosphohistidine phosphatase SixA